MIHQIKHLIGDLARPFAIWWTSGAAGIAIVRLARPDTDLSGAAVYIGLHFKLKVGEVHDIRRIVLRRG